MAKFKVGDRVRRLQGTHMGIRPDDEATVTRTMAYNHVELDAYRGQHDCNMLELDIPSPIRTITRREIVPGEYGGVTVEGVDAPWRKVRYEGFIEAQSLRDAAHIFNEIADVLDENSKEAV